MAYVADWVGEKQPPPGKWLCFHHHFFVVRVILSNPQGEKFPLWFFSVEKPIIPFSPRFFEVNDAKDASGQGRALNFSDFVVWVVTFG